MSTGSFSDGDDEAIAKLEAEEKEYAAQLEALQAEHATTSAAPHTVGAIDLAAENARLKAQLAAMESASAVKSTSRGESKLAGPRAELKELEAKNAALADALASGDGLSKLTTLKAAAASKARSVALSSSLTKSSIAHSEMKSAMRDLETREKGVDICMLMDGTGSMGWCLSACKTKANEIMSAAGTVHPEAVTRVACVIYRDFCDGARCLETIDFAGKQDLGSITSFLSGVYADGGGDECEDVAGGLKEALKLSWKSSTKLLIHFGDAPAHGSKYHNGRANDNHPSGCPHGLVQSVLSLDSEAGQH